jgi:hypothetical protein
MRRLYLQLTGPKHTDPKINESREYAFWIFSVHNWIGMDRYQQVLVLCVDADHIIVVSKLDFNTKTCIRSGQNGRQLLLVYQELNFLSC